MATQTKPETQAVKAEVEVVVTPEMLAFYLGGQDDETDMNKRGGEHED